MNGVDAVLISFWVSATIAIGWMCFNIAFPKELRDYIKKLLLKDKP